jgi:hypothetical protein
MIIEGVIITTLLQIWLLVGHASLHAPELRFYFAIEAILDFIHICHYCYCGKCGSLCFALFVLVWRKAPRSIVSNQHVLQAAVSSPHCPGLGLFL